jgi:hypothetical protein
MTNILVDNKELYNIQYYFIKYFNYIFTIIIILFLIGIITNIPTFFIEINFLVKIFIALFLIYRYNPYRKHNIKITELDKTLAYLAGIYIIFISFADYIYVFSRIIRNKVTEYVFINS